MKRTAEKAVKYMRQDCGECRDKDTCPDYMNEAVAIRRYQMSRSTCPKKKSIFLRRTEKAPK